MGYQRFFPLAVVFGSKHYGRIGMTHITAAQMSAKINGTVKHVRAKTKTGDKFIAMTRQAQLSARTDTPIFEETRPIKYLEDKWMPRLLA
eukprot:15356485-Ditylum_brightwellii.AAC.1